MEDRMPRPRSHRTTTTINLETFPLSGRELEVLQLLASGEPTKRVASILGISPKTVETHRTKIIDRLNLLIDNGTRIVEFTHLAIALGLVKVKYRVQGISPVITKFRKAHKKL
ncbi:MAG: hypothetical protein RLZZ347_277 [Candidatus Parcubacteria bacterium]|jgi:DNA-binding CsgD family transcriptional regulator